MVLAIQPYQEAITPSQIPKLILNRIREDEALVATPGSMAAVATAAAAAGIDTIVARPEHADELIMTKENTPASFPRYRRMLE